MHSTERKQSVETLFEEAGHDWRDMEQPSAVDVSDQNIQIQANDNSWRNVEKLIRKKDSTAWALTPLGGDYESLICTAEHKVKTKDEDSIVFREVQDLNPEKEKIQHNGTWKDFYVEKTDRTTPVLDFVLGPEHDYLSNGITSHNTMYGPSYVVPGGNAIPFHASVRVELRKSKRIDGKVNGKKQAVGATIRPRIRKNRLAPPERTTEFDLFFNSGIDDTGSWFDELKDNNWLQHSSRGWYYVADEVDNDGNIVKYWQSDGEPTEDKDQASKVQEASFKDRLDEDPEFYQYILERLQQSVLVSYDQDWTRNGDISYSENKDSGSNED